MEFSKKLIKFGNSRGIIIPQDWLRYHEDKLGHPIKEVFIEMNEALIIRAMKKDKQ